MSKESQSVSRTRQPEAGDALALTIPYAPMSLNKMLRSHWSVKSKQKNRWTEELACSAMSRHPRDRMALCGMAIDKQKVRVEVEIHHSRLFDEDNLHGACKPLFDAIVSLGWAYDDRPEFMERQVMQFKSKRKEQRTIVRISRTEICVKGL